MLYYTIHSDTGAPHYVHFDVTSVAAVVWKFFYTHHSDTDVPQCVYSAKKKKKGK
jgi:hypothetical protein